ncbi:MAG: hypothetical protein QXL69_03600 [Candidatus Bathyarchaeia archaeon]
MCTTSLLTGVITGIFTIVGVVIGFLLNWYYEFKKRAEVMIEDEPLIFKFPLSVRIIFRVTHKKGSLPATNAICYLSIEAHEESLNKFLIPKSNGCILPLTCKMCNFKYYLVPYKEGKIFNEPLPWSISIPAGFGLDQLPYHHVAHIPVKGENKINLFDIYKYEEFYLVKVHSEYGVYEYPRACIKLPITQEIKCEIKFKLIIAAENLRKSNILTVRIKKEGKKFVIETNGWRKTIEEVTKDILNIKVKEMTGP